MNTRAPSVFFMIFFMYSTYLHVDGNLRTRVTELGTLPA